LSKNNNSQKQESNNSFIVILILLFFLLNHQVYLANASHQAATPLFNVKLLAPTSGPITIQERIAGLLQEHLSKIGISVELDLTSWARLGPRVTDQEVGAYADGGYDIAVFGIYMGFPTSHPINNIYNVYRSESIPPNGLNVMYWSPETSKGYNNYRAQESDDLLKKIMSNPNLTEIKRDFFDWQMIWYDVMPNILIYNEYEVHAISTGLYGYDPLKNPLSSLETTWLTSDYTGAADTIVFAAKAGAIALNYYLGLNMYSRYASTPVMDTLYGLTPSKDVILQVETNRTQWMLDNYGTDEFLALYPRVAATMGSYSPDGLQYNVSVRDDVLWHDGHVFDAWDVAFSFQAGLIPELWSRYYSGPFVPHLFGKDDPVNHHGNYSFIVADKNNDDHYEHISFQLNETYSPLELNYLRECPILPEHILGDQTNHGFHPNGTFDPLLWNVKPLDWEAHSFNTGRTSDPGSLTGLIGTGSMVFKEFKEGTGLYPENSEVTLEKFEDVIWDGDSWETQTGNSHFLAKDIDTMPTKATIIVASLDGGLADMKTGNVNILDPQFTMSTIWEELQAETATINSFKVIEAGWQGQVLHLNPKFVQDGVYHLQKKGVRHAISHMIPREDIITLYFDPLQVPRYRLAIPAYTPLHVSSWAAIPEADLLSYKKTLTAIDGTTPEKNTKSAYDEYSINISLNWLASEGYDVEPWRNPTSSTTAHSSTALSSTTDLFTTAGWALLILFLELFTFFFLFFFLQRLKR
jgi:ABC-type transport system substrate-binding protein